jgi:hypothetical protein
MSHYEDLRGSAGKAARILKPNTDGEKDPPSLPPIDVLGKTATISLGITEKQVAALFSRLRSRVNLPRNECLASSR